MGLLLFQDYNGLSKLDRIGMTIFYDEYSLLQLFFLYYIFHVIIENSGLLWTEDMYTLSIDDF